MAERDTLRTWMEAMNKNELSLPMVKTYIANMKLAVEQELTNTEHNSKQDIFLKARLRNYMLLEAFLSTPEKAKESVEKAISSLVSKVKGV